MMDQDIIRAITDGEPFVPVARVPAILGIEYGKNGVASWFQRGVKSVTGETRKLPTVKIAGKRYTKKSWLERFLTEVSGAPIRVLDQTGGAE